MSSIHLGELISIYGNNYGKENASRSIVKMFYQDEVTKLYQGDCRSMSELKDESVQMEG